MDTSYLVWAGLAVLLIGSAVELRSGDQVVRLAYHPCMGAYLLNRDIYRKRRMLVVDSTAGGADPSQHASRARRQP